MRQLGRGMRRSGIVLATVVLAGCTNVPSPSATPSPEPTRPVGVTPSVNASPSPSLIPTPNPAAYPACTASDLVLVGEGWGGATGSLSGGAIVVNASVHDCVLEGQPDVAILDAGGVVIARGPAGQPVASSGQPVVLAPAATASAGIAWSNWCGAAPREPLHLRVTLPNGGGTLAGRLAIAGQTPPAILPRCDNPGAGSSVTAYSAFASPGPTAGAGEAPCTADQLVAFTGPSGPAAGTEFMTIVVLNVPGLDCLLPTSPTIELRDASGALLVTGRPFQPSSPDLVLPAGWAASADAGLADWCMAQPNLPLALDLVIGGSRVPVEVRTPIYVPACGVAGESHPPYFGFAAAMSLP